MFGVLQEGLSKVSAWLGLLLAVGGVYGLGAQALAQELVPGHWLLSSGPAGQETFYTSEVSGDGSLLDGSASLGLSSAEGSNIGNRFMVPRRLTSEADQTEAPERHREVGLDIDAIRSGPVTLALSGIFVDDRSLTTQSSFELNQINGWRQSRTTDLGLSLGE